MEKILQVIQDIHQNFTSDIENFNFDVLRKKREELIDLGKIIGCKEGFFKDYLNLWMFHISIPVFLIHFGDIIRRRLLMIS